MADLDFPLNPQVNDIYTFNSRTFKYDGAKWRYFSVSVVTINSGTAVTSINSLTSSAQDFAVGVSGSGFNVASTGNTHTFNIPIAGSGSTGLITGIGQIIAGPKTFSSNLAVSSSTASTNTSTGAFSVSGGVGIGDSLNIAGRINLWNSTNYTSFVSSASGNTVYTLPATSPSTGTSVLQSTSAGVMSWVPMVASSSSSGNTSQNIVINTAGNANVFHPVLITPSALSAGSAISSDTTITFNPSSEILYVSGLAVTATTASTSTSNGALQVAGGVGISGKLSFNQASFGTTGIANNPTMAMIGTTGDPIYMSVLEDNSLSLEGSQGQLFSITPNLSTGYIYSVNDITGIPLLRANANANVTANEYAGNFGIGLTNPGYKLHVLGSVGFTSVTASTSTTTGTLVVSGGVGIGGSIFGASTISAADNIEIKSGKELRLNNSGNTFYTGLKAGSNASNTTYTFPAAFPGAGTSVLQSDTSGNLSWIGTVGLATTATNINVVSASTSASHRVLFTPASGSASGAAVSSNTTLVYNPSTNILSVSGLAVTSGLRLNNDNGNYLSFDINSSGGANASRGNIEATAGLAIIAENSILNLSYSGEHIFDSGGGYCLIVGGTGVSVVLSDASTSSTSGALTVSGGAGIAKTSYFGQDVKIQGTTASASTTTGALVATGGVGIGGSVSVGGRLQLFSGVNYTAFVSSATGNTVYTLPATSPATGSSVLQSTSAGVLSWVPMTAGSSSGNTSQNIVINTAGNANVFHPVLLTPSSLSAGSAVSSDSTITFNPSTEILNVSGLAVTSGTASTNTTTGALVVRGGLGVTGQLSFATASFGFTGITTNPTMSFIGATSSSPITLTVLTDNSLNFEGSQGSVFSIDSNLSTGEIFSVSDISGLPIISASAGQTVTINEFGGFTRIGNGSISSTGASNSAANGSLVVYGGVGVTGELSVGGKLQIFNGTKYAAFVSSSTGNTIYTLPPTSPAVGTSYLTSNSSGVMSWTAPNKANYVLSFGAGFTPTADSADSVSLNVPYLPDGTLKYYYIKRIEYRNETLSGGTGLSFYLQRHTTGNASWNTTNTITAGSGASFYIGPSVYASSFTTIASSAGVAGSVISGDYLRLFFTGVGSAANLSIAITIEEQ